MPNTQYQRHVHEDELWSFTEISMSRSKRKKGPLSMTTRQGMVMLLLVATFLVLLLIIIMRWQ